MTKIKNTKDKLVEVLFKEKPILEMLLVKAKNNSIKLLSKSKKTKKIINKNKK
jgi:hypothetical protein